MAAANVLWDAGEGDPTEKRGAMGCYTIGDRMVNVGSGNYIGIRPILRRFMQGKACVCPNPGWRFHKDTIRPNRRKLFL